MFVSIKLSPHEKLFRLLYTIFISSSSSSNAVIFAAAVSININDIILPVQASLT
jgi:hypothetical protein